MNLGTLRTRILENLCDPSGIYWAQTKVNNSIQDGYNEIVLETECIEAMATIEFQPGQIYYDLYQDLTAPCFWKPVRIFNNQSNRWLDFNGLRMLERRFYSWERTVSNSWFAYIVNYQWLGFFPHNNGQAFSFDLYYKVCPDYLISDSQCLQIPESFIKVLENWCTADLLESVQEFTKAAGYLQDYENELENLKTHVRNRMLPVKQQILNPFYS